MMGHLGGPESEPRIRTRPPEDEASNAICRKAGFTLGGEYDFWPGGTRRNDWYRSDG